MSNEYIDPIAFENNIYKKSKELAEQIIHFLKTLDKTTVYRSEFLESLITHINIQNDEFEIMFVNKRIQEIKREKLKNDQNINNRLNKMLKTQSDIVDSLEHRLQLEGQDNIELSKNNEQLNAKIALLTAEQEDLDKNLTFVEDENEELTKWNNTQKQTIKSQRKDLRELWTFKENVKKSEK